MFSQNSREGSTLTDDGVVAGHVDLAALGVADLWNET